jgi:hypothetical protein
LPLLFSHFILHREGVYKGRKKIACWLERAVCSSKGGREKLNYEEWLVPLP